MKLETITPTKVIECSSKKNLNYLLKKTVLQPELTNEKCVYIKDGYIVLDFGKEYYGEPHIITSFIDEGKPIKIRVRYGESLSECYSTVGEHGATNDHSIRDYTIDLPFYSNACLQKSGFRFMRVDFLDKDRGAYIKSIALVVKKDERKPICTYKGNDELIKKIYEAAKRTVDLCSLNGLVWDGVKRDELVWAGDLHPEALALFTLYGRSKELEASIDFLRKGHKLPSYMNNFPTYSLWWMAVVSDYYFNDKSNVSFIKRQLPYIEKLVEQYDNVIKDDGDLNFPQYFVDWPTVDSKDVLAGSRAIAIIGIKKAKALLKEFNMSTTHCDSVLNKLNRVEIVAKEMKQVVALKYLATGKMSDEEYKLLTKGGANGLSTFMSYYILNAIASRDEALAIKIMKDYYGAMLDLGATTFFEDFDISWAKDTARIDEFAKENQHDLHRDFGKYCYLGYRHSLCHGWSAGVIKFIKEHC